MNPLHELALAIGEELKKRQLKLATAESCTGGGLSYWITSIPGSSNWFDCGFVTYSDESKISMLSVKPITLQSFGAVSEPTAREMAEGALKNSNASVSIAITGIAGPDGGSAQKPVGTVWIAFAKKNASTLAQVDLFVGDREKIRTQTIERALTDFYKIL